MQDIQKKVYRLCILQCPISECGNFFEKKTLILKDSLISQQTKKKARKEKTRV